MSTEIANPESIAAVVLPTYIPEDSDMARYLSYRVTGFTIMEACELTHISYETVKRWRKEDPSFKQLDTGDMYQLRKDLSKNYLDIEYTRNFHLMLERDRELLFKSMRNPEGLTKDEENYITKIRSMYTPQQLSQMRDLLEDRGSKAKEFSWEELVLRRKITNTDGTIVEESIEAKSDG